MSRRIYFEVTGETDWTKKIDPDMGSIAVLLFYADQLDPVMGEKMLYAVISEETYRFGNDLPESEHGPDNFLAHYGVNEMPELIGFIDYQLLPALQNEVQTMDIVFDIFNSYDDFADVYYDRSDCPGYPGICPDDVIEGYTGYVPNMIRKALKLRDFFKRVIDRNTSYRVFIE